MHRNRRTLLALASAGLAVLALSACGSDSGSTSGGPSSAGSSDELCTYANDLEQSLSEDAFATMDEATFEQIGDIVANVRDKAPEEIRADVETVADGFANVQEIFAEYDYDLAKLTAAAAADPELTERLQSFGGEEFTSASDRVNAYLDDTCGIASGS